MDGDIEKYLRNLRDAEMPAMSRALELLPTMQFAQQATLVPEFDRLFKTLTAEQKEFWDDVAKPKASRRAALPKEYQETTQGLLDTLEQTVRRRSPPPSTIRTPRSTSCWRSSRPPGCCATPPARRR